MTTNLERNSSYKKRIFISYPRSGSNLIFNTYKHINPTNIKNFCYNYDKCNSVPCNCDEPKLITKTHDFDQKLEYNPENIYLVLMRKDPIENIEGYLRMRLSAIVNPSQCWKTNELKLKLENKLHMEILNKHTEDCCIYFKKFKHKVEEWSNYKNVNLINKEDLDNIEDIKPLLNNFFMLENNLLIENINRYSNFNKNNIDDDVYNYIKNIYDKVKLE